MNWFIKYEMLKSLLKFNRPQNAYKKVNCQTGANSLKKVFSRLC